MYDCPEAGAPVSFWWAASSGSALSAAGCSSVESNQRMPAAMHKVFADSDWYIARPEAEQEWRGVLRERHVTLGPASRATVSLELIVEGGDPLPVYAATIRPRLAQHIGSTVTIRGKLVDLTHEGQGKELWIGWILP
jgi:hypothetical protein